MSSNRPLYVDILDNDGCVIGVAHASSHVNNDAFVSMMEHINELTYNDNGCWYINPDDLEDYSNVK